MGFWIMVDFRPQKAVDPCTLSETVRSRDEPSVLCYGLVAGPTAAVTVQYSISLRSSESRMTASPVYLDQSMVRFYLNRLKYRKRLKYLNRSWSMRCVETRQDPRSEHRQRQKTRNGKRKQKRNGFTTSMHYTIWPPKCQGKSLDRLNDTATKWDQAMRWVFSKQAVFSSWIYKNQEMLLVAFLLCKSG